MLNNQNILKNFIVSYGCTNEFKVSICVSVANIYLTFIVTIPVKEKPKWAKDVKKRQIKF